MLVKLTKLSSGFVVASSLALVTVSWISNHNSDRSLLSLSIFTAFALINLFDFGLSRLTLNLSSVNPIRIRNFSIILLSYTIGVSFLCICSLYIVNRSTVLEASTLISLGLQVTLCGMPNIYRSIFESHGAYGKVSIARVIQSISICGVALTAAADSALSLIVFIFVLIVNIMWYLFVVSHGFILLTPVIDKHYSLPSQAIVNRYIANPSLKIYVHILLASFLVTCSNLGDRFVFATSLDPSDLSSYLALQEILSKIVAVSTMTSISFFSDVSVFRRTSNSTDPTVYMKLLKKYLLLQSPLIVTATVIVLSYILIFLPAIAKSISFGYLLLISFGLFLNTIAALLSTFLEALQEHRIRTISASIFSTITILSLFVVSRVFSFPSSVASFWILKGSSEVIVLLISVKKLIQTRITSSI